MILPAGAYGYEESLPNPYFNPAPEEGLKTLLIYAAVGAVIYFAFLRR